MAITSTSTMIPLGDRGNRKQGVVIIPAKAEANKPGVLDIQSVSGTTVTDVYLWPTSTNTWRYGTTFPTTPDSDGSAFGSGADTALSNLASVAINTTLVSDANNTDDLGSSTYSWRSAYLGTSLVFKETGGNITITTDNPSAARAYSIPDAGADATVMLDTGATNVIAYTKGTSTIAMAANADLDIAAGITVNIDAATTITTALTVNTESVTLNQSLSTTDDVTFAALTTTTTSAGTLALAAASITDSSGAISFGNENLTTTGTINLASDNVNITLGASGATDSRIFFDGAGNLMFYDSNMAASRSLTELYTGTTLNPSVSGNLTITDGNFTWTNTSNSETAVFTLAATTVDGIQIASSNTTADAVQITANGTTSGNVLALIAVDATLAGGGGYLYCYDGAAQDFAIRRYGATTIAGNASTDILTITAGDLQITAGDIDIDLGRIEVDNTADEGNTIKRNNATGTAPVLEVEQSHATGGVGLLVDQDATGDVNALEITNAGTGFSATATGAAAGSRGFEFIAAASATGAGLLLDGTTGSYIGADNTGFAWITSDGVLAAGGNLLRVASTGANAAGSFMVEIESTGALAGASDGACLKISETGAAAATSYAVNISSTSNEALHVDAGLSLFDERVTITLADNTGPALAITNPDTTGNSNAVTITPSGSGAGLYIAPQEADTVALSVVGVASSTVSAIKVDGSAGAGWFGAANVGMLHLVNDGTYADVAATELYIGNSGVPADDSRGHCLRIVDTGNASAGTMAYPVYISSNDATVGGVYITTNAAGAALTVAAGTASFAGVVTFTAGLKTKVAVTDTANPPTNNEMITAFGAAATTGAGFIGILDDANGHANEYICWSDGTKYWYATGTAGA